MAAITASMVAELRAKTDAPMMECKKALTEADGDMAKAEELLRVKLGTKAGKAASRVTAEGVVASAISGTTGSLIEVNCETDFVGRSEAFREFAHEIALQVAAASPAYIREEDIPQEVLDHEAAIATAKAREEGKPEAILPRIVEGNLNKYKDEVVLLRQKYIRDEAITIQQLLNDTVLKTGENIVIRRFTRWALGESSGE